MKPLRERVRTVRRNLRVEGPQIARILVAAAVSWELCVWLGATQPPVFAVVVPLVAMRDAPDSALNVSVARLVGVVAGLSIGIAVLSWLRPSAVSVVLVLALALGVGVVLRIGDTLNLQVAISALLLFANADPAAYAVSRLWETSVGAAVTIVLSPLLLHGDHLVDPVACRRRAGVQHASRHAGLVAGQRSVPPLDPSAALRGGGGRVGRHAEHDRRGEGQDRRPRVQRGGSDAVRCDHPTPAAPDDRAPDRVDVRETADPGARMGRVTPS
jgi:hypothetical protein